MPKLYCPNKATDTYKEVSKGLKGDERRITEFFMKIGDDKFKKWYGKGERISYGAIPDVDGYPKIHNGTDIINGVGEKITIFEFGNSEAFKISEKNRKANEKLSNEAGVHKKIIKNIQDILIKKIAMYQKTAKVQLDVDGKKMVSPYIQTIDNLINDLELATNDSALVTFVDNAVKEISQAYTRIQKLVDKFEEHEIGEFEQLTQYVTAYDVLDEVREILNKDVNIDKSYIKILDTAIVNRNEMKKIYLTISKDKIADVFEPLSHNLSKDELKDLMDVAPKDISWFAKNTMYAGSSEDNLLSLVAITINNVQADTRDEHIDIMIKLNSKLKSLETIKNTINPLKLYDEILETDKNGELTGYYISEYNIGGFKKERTRFFDSINERAKNGTLTESVRKAEIKAWYSKNYITGSNTLRDIWKNEKFAKLEEHRKNGTNKEMIEFYDYFHKVYTEMQEKIPAYYSMGYKLPSIRKETIDRIIEGNITDTFEILKASAKDTFVRQEGDNILGELTNESGDVINKVPIFFTGNFPVKEMSMDLGHLLKNFSAMAINYENMNKVIDVIEATEVILKERKILKTDSKGNKILNSLKGLKNKDTYTKGIDSNVLKQFQDFIAVQVYGQTTTDLGEKNVFGIKLDVNKTLNALTGYTVKNLLIGNFLNDFSNKTLGEVMNWIEAGADSLYSAKNYTSANVEYNKNLLNMLGDVAERTPTNKINVICQHLNTFQDYRNSINENSNKSKHAKLLSTNSLFLGMRMAEHGIASKVTIAALKKLQPLHNGLPIEGLNEMYDAIIVKEDGSWEIDKRVTNFGKNEQRILGRKIGETLRNNHGNYSNETAAAWQRSAILRMVGSLRRHLPTGYSRRFSGLRDSQIMQSKTEGTYITTAKFIGKIVKDLKHLQLDLLKEDWNNLEEFEKQNIKRTIGEIGVLLITLAAISVLSGLPDDEDDIDNRMKLLLAYQAVRLKTELTAYANPFDALKLMKSPAASLGMIESVIKLGHQLITDPSERYVKGYLKGELKIEKDFFQTVPLYRHFKNFNSEGLSSKISWFQNLNSASGR